MTEGALAQVMYAARRPAARSVFTAPVRLPTDDADHPYGQWTLVVEFVSDELAQVRFLMPQAPHDQLIRGRTLELFEGRKAVARLRVLVSAHDSKNTLGTKPSMPPRVVARMVCVGVVLPSAILPSLRRSMREG